MLRELLEELYDSGVFHVLVAVVGLVLIVLLLFSPFIYLDGVGKSKYLKETQNIELAWYHALGVPDNAFIDINSVNSNTVFTSEADGAK